MLVLPDEILLLIAESLCAQADVNSLSRASRRLHLFFDPLLYRRNAEQSSGSAMVWAAYQGIEATAERAIDAGAASFNESIVTAAQQGKSGVMRVLLRRCNLDIRRVCWDALLTSVRGDHLEVMEALIQSNKVGSFAEMVEGYEDNPLMYCGLFNRPAAAELLLNWGRIPVNARNQITITTLGEAAKNGFCDVVKVLLDNSSADVNAEDWAGRTPLFFAARQGYHEIVELLLASDDIKVDTPDALPLHTAISKGHVSVVKALLESGKVYINSRDAEEMSGLMHAAIRNHETIVAMLLRCANIDTQAVDIQGHTALFYALEEGHVGIANMLRAHQQD